MTKKIISIIGITLLSTSMSYATSPEKNTLTIKKETMICLSSCCISTYELEKEVEKRSIEGTMPVEMGLELIKRWSHNKITA